MTLSKGARYKRRMVRLGFKQGLTTKAAILHQRAYQRNYRRLHNLEDKEASDKYDRKARHYFPGGTLLSKALYAAESKNKRLMQRKIDADAAHKEMLKLLKMFKNVHNRRYHLKNLHSNSSGRSHPAKLQRRDDM